MVYNHYTIQKGNYIIVGNVNYKNAYQWVKQTSYLFYRNDNKPIFLSRCHRLNTYCLFNLF